MIHTAEHLLGTEHRAPIGLKTGQSNRPGALMQENTVNIYKIRMIVLTLDQVLIPQLVKEGAPPKYCFFDDSLIK
ncbi:MAG: hypothetical protein ACI87W_000340 [Halieaceae bacterium]|jgi:hypothetical protein